MLLRGRSFFRNGGSVDPAPDFLLRYLLDGSDANLVEVNAPSYYDAPEPNDLTGVLLDGTSQYYTANADLPVINAIGSNPMSWCFWFNTSDMTNADIVVNMSGGGAADSLQIQLNDVGSVRFRINNSNYNTISTFADAEWHFCVCSTTGSGGTYEILVDDAVQLSGAVTAYNINSRVHFSVGATIAGIDPFKGLLDGIRYYDRSLTIEEKTGLYNQGVIPYAIPDHIIRYKLDGSDPSLVPVNSPSIVAAPARLDLQGSQFNGVDQLYDATNDDVLWSSPAAGAFSISFWINTVTSGTGDIVRTGTGSSQNDYRVRKTSLGQVAFRVNSITMETTTNFHDVGWKHVVCVSTGSVGNFKIYVDGVVDYDQVMTTYNLTTQPSVRVGATSLSSGFLNGSLDDLRLYDRALNETEVTALFNDKV